MTDAMRPARPEGDRDRRGGGGYRARTRGPEGGRRGPGGGRGGDRDRGGDRGGNRRHSEPTPATPPPEPTLEQWRNAAAPGTPERKERDRAIAKMERLNSIDARLTEGQKIDKAESLRTVAEKWKKYPLYKKIAIGSLLGAGGLFSGFASAAAIGTLAWRGVSLAGTGLTTYFATYAYMRKRNYDEKKSKRVGALAAGLSGVVTFFAGRMLGEFIAGKLGLVPNTGPQSGRIGSGGPMTLDQHRPRLNILQEPHKTPPNMSTAKHPFFEVQPGKTPIPQPIEDIPSRPRVTPDSPSRLGGVVMPEPTLVAGLDVSVPKNTRFYDFLSTQFYGTRGPLGFIDPSQPNATLCENQLNQTVNYILSHRSGDPVVAQFFNVDKMTIGEKTIFDQMMHKASMGGEIRIPMEMQMNMRVLASDEFLEQIRTTLPRFGTHIQDTLKERGLKFDAVRAAFKGKYLGS